MKKEFMLCLILLLGFRAQAQEQEAQAVTAPRFRVGVELGMSLLYGDANKPDRIRESSSYYQDYASSYSSDVDVYTNFTMRYIGVKSEYTLSKRFAVAAGLRFSANTLTFETTDRISAWLFGDGGDYFLWKIREDGLNTDYLRIEAMAQKNRYVGVPLEVKFFPREKEHPGRLYFTAGGALNVLVQSSNEVRFQDLHMQKYLSDVRNQIGKPSPFQGYLHAGLGLKLGNSKYPHGDIELHFPVCTFTGSSSKLFMKNPVGLGIRTTIQMPIS